MASGTLNQPDRKGEPFFSQPIRQVLMVLIALGLFGSGAWVAYPRVAPVFLSNPTLNGIILVVFVIGLLACFWQLGQLIRAVGWVLAFTSDRAEGRDPGPLLAPLAALLSNRGAGKAISAMSARSILESVIARIDEARDITRYLSNLLIFLGLLGTFYGLATTVPAVVDTIRSLAPSPGEGAGEVFGRLMRGLEDQLGGMGTAFASSLLGLAGSLIIGLLELFVSHGQNRFTRELEDWLSTIARIGLASDSEAGADVAMMESFAEHIAGQVDRLQDLLLRTEAGRAENENRLAALIAAVDALRETAAGRPAASAVDPGLARLADSQERLTLALETGFRQQQQSQADAAGRLADDQRRLLAALEAGKEQQDAARADARSDVARLTEGQERLIAAVEGGLARQADAQADASNRVAIGQNRLAAVLEDALRRIEAAEGQAADGGGYLDAESRMRLRSIDVQLLRILEEVAAGRQETVQDLRAELAALTRAVRQLREPGELALQARRG